MVDMLVVSSLQSAFPVDVAVLRSGGGGRDGVRGRRTRRKYSHNKANLEKFVINSFFLFACGMRRE
jgi:hypothetical protein